MALLHRNPPLLLLCPKLRFMYDFCKWSNAFVGTDKVCNYERCLVTKYFIVLWSYYPKSSVWLYMSISKKSTLFIEMHPLMWVRCVLYDRGFDFWQRQGFYPSLSSPDRTSSTAYHVVTMSVNICLTFMWSVIYLHRKAVGNFNTYSLSWKSPDFGKFVKNISLVKNLKPDEIVRFIGLARFTGTLAYVWMGAARGWRGVDWGRSIITDTPGRWQCCTVCCER